MYLINGHKSYYLISKLIGGLFVTKKTAKKVTAKKTAPKTKKTATKKVAPKKAK